MRPLRLPLATALMLAAAVACGSTAASPGTSVASLAAAQSAEAQKCDTDGRLVLEGYSKTLTLVAALPTTAKAAAQWEMTRFGPNGPRPVVSRWSGLPADHHVLFCYFHGDFANYAPPGPPRPLIHQRALVFVTDGQGPWLDHIGSKANTPLTAP